MKTTARKVHFYDLHMKSYAPKIQDPGHASMADLFAAINGIAVKGHVVVEHSDELIEVGEWKYDAKAHTLGILINRADRTLSDVTFKDLGTKATRKGGKTTAEGIDASCHVLIRVDPGGLKGLFLMTMGTGIAFTTVVKLLNTQLKALQKSGTAPKLFEFPHPSGEKVNGKPKTYEVEYHVKAVAHKSKLLIDALDKGEFVGMELVGHTHRNLDSDGNFQEHGQSLKVKASPMHKKVTAATVVNALTKWRKENPHSDYDSVRIDYRLGGSPQSAPLSLNDLESAFTRKEWIALDPPVEQQQSSLNPTIVSAMAALFK